MQTCHGTAPCAGTPAEVDCLQGHWHMGGHAWLGRSCNGVSLMAWSGSYLAMEGVGVELITMEKGTLLEHSLEQEKRRLRRLHASCGHWGTCVTDVIAHSNSRGKGPLGCASSSLLAL
jgi:hypothetical protein